MLCYLYLLAHTHDDDGDDVVDYDYGYDYDYRITITMTMAMTITMTLTMTDYVDDEVDLTMTTMKATTIGVMTATMMNVISTSIPTKSTITSLLKKMITSVSYNPSPDPNGELSNSQTLIAAMVMI